MALFATLWSARDKASLKSRRQARLACPGSVSCLLFEFATGAPPCRNCLIRTRIWIKKSSTPIATRRSSGASRGRQHESRRGRTASSSAACFELAQRHPDMFAAVGIQPNYCARRRKIGTRYWPWPAGRESLRRRDGARSVLGLHAAGRAAGLFRSASATIATDGTAVHRAHAREDADVLAMLREARFAARWRRNARSPAAARRPPNAWSSGCTSALPAW